MIRRSYVPGKNTTRNNLENDRKNIASDDKLMKDYSFYDTEHKGNILYDNTYNPNRKVGSNFELQTKTVNLEPNDSRGYDYDDNNHQLEIKIGLSDESNSEYNSSSSDNLSDESTQKHNLQVTSNRSTTPSTNILYFDFFDDETNEKNSEEMRNSRSEAKRVLQSVSNTYNPNYSALYQINETNTDDKATNETKINFDPSIKIPVFRTAPLIDKTELYNDKTTQNKEHAYVITINQDENEDSNIKLRNSLGFFGDETNEKQSKEMRNLNNGAKRVLQSLPKSYNLTTIGDVKVEKSNNLKKTKSVEDTGMNIDIRRIFGNKPEYHIPVSLQYDSVSDENDINAVNKPSNKISALGMTDKRNEEGIQKYDEKDNLSSNTEEISNILDAFSRILSEVDLNKLLNEAESNGDLRKDTTSGDEKLEKAIKEVDENIKPSLRMSLFDDVPPEIQKLGQKDRMEDIVNNANGDAKTSSDDSGVKTRSRFDMFHTLSLLKAMKGNHKKKENDVDFIYDKADLIPQEIFDDGIKNNYNFNDNNKISHFKKIPPSIAQYFRKKKLRNNQRNSRYLDFFNAATIKNYKRKTDEVSKETKLMNFENLFDYITPAIENLATNTENIDCPKAQAWSRLMTYLLARPQRYSWETREDQLFALAKEAEDAKKAQDTNVPTIKIITNNLTGKNYRGLIKDIKAAVKRYKKKAKATIRRQKKVKEYTLKLQNLSNYHSDSKKEPTRIVEESSEEVPLFDGNINEFNDNSQLHKKLVKENSTPVLTADKKKISEQILTSSPKTIQAATSFKPLTTTVPQFLDMDSEQSSGVDSEQSLDMDSGELRYRKKFSHRTFVTSVPKAKRLMHTTNLPSVRKQTAATEKQLGGPRYINKLSESVLTTALPETHRLLLTSSREQNAATEKQRFRSISAIINANLEPTSTSSVSVTAEISRSTENELKEMQIEEDLEGFTEEKKNTSRRTGYPAEQVAVLTTGKNNISSNEMSATNNEKIKNTVKSDNPMSVSDMSALNLINDILSKLQTTIKIVKNNKEQVNKEIRQKNNKHLVNKISDVLHNITQLFQKDKTLARKRSFYDMMRNGPTKFRYTRPRNNIFKHAPPEHLFVPGPW